MLGIIMAGGKGTRLMPLTLHRPKPLVEVLGRPVIDYVKEAMLDAGITDVVVTTGYRGEQLEQHVASWMNGTTNIRARVNQESSPMGTAGSVGLLRNEIAQTCVVGSGDAVASFDIGALLAAHRKNKAKVTMALWQVEDPSEFGIVGLSATSDGPVDGDLREGFIRRFLEKPKPEEAFSNVINAGLYILEPEVFEHVPLGEKFDFSKQLFPRLLELGWPMYAQAIDGVWFDVGHPFELLNAQSTLIERYDELPFTYPNNFVEFNGVLTASSSSMNGTAADAVIGSSCVVGHESKLERALLMDGCQIGAGSQIIESVLGRNVQVGDGCRVHRCIVGDGTVLEPNGHYVDQRIPN